MRCAESEVRCCIFLDKKKALDTIHNELLLMKLEQNDIKSVAFDWLRSELSDK